MLNLLLRLIMQAYLFYGCVSPADRPQLTTFIGAGIYGGIKEQMPEQFQHVITDKKMDATVR
jgi:hypothetical protein